LCGKGGRAFLTQRFPGLKLPDSMPFPPRLRFVEKTRRTNDGDEKPRSAKKAWRPDEMGKTI